MDQFLQRIGIISSKVAEVENVDLAPIMTVFEQEVHAGRNMSFKSFYFFTLIGMAILYGTMWGGPQCTGSASKSIVKWYSLVLDS